MSKKTVKYSEAIGELEQLVARIEGNELDIDELSETLKRVSELLRFCKAKLRSTEEEVQKIMKDFAEA